MKFDRKFDKYVCIGDTITADATDKMQLVATIVYDDHCNPRDDEWYGEKDVARWLNDEWCFVGVVLSIQSHDGTIKAHLDSLWGLEANIRDDNDHLTDVANQLICEKQILNTLESIKEPVSRAIESLTHTN